MKEEKLTWKKVFFFELKNTRDSLVHSVAQFLKQKKLSEVLSSGGIEFRLALDHGFSRHSSSLLRGRKEVHEKLLSELQSLLQHIVLLDQRMLLLFRALLLNSLLSLDVYLSDHLLIVQVLNLVRLGTSNQIIISGDSGGSRRVGKLIDLNSGSFNGLSINIGFRDNFESSVIIGGLLVLLKLEKSQEALVAASMRADISLLILVLKHMVSQGRFCGESSVATLEFAFVRVLVSVDSSVVLQGIGSLEALVATLKLADVRSLSSVSGTVSDNLRFKSEDLATIVDLANVGLLVGVVGVLDLEQSFQTRESVGVHL